MPPIQQVRGKDKPVKVLVMADSGAGKTGSLASLAKAGYNVRVIDMDNGLEPLYEALQDSPEAMDRVSFQTFTNKWKAQGNDAIPDGMPKAFQQALKQLTHWKSTDPKTGEVEDFGKLEDWTTNDVLVIDSLTFLAKAAFHHVLYMNNRITQHPHQSDWGSAQGLVEHALELIYAEQVRTNVVVLTHVMNMEDESGLVKLAPASLGKALTPRLGRYFNGLLLLKSKSSGSQAKRVFRTVSEGKAELKNPAFNTMPTELPIETGLAEYFRICRGETNQ